MQQPGSICLVQRGDDPKTPRRETWGCVRCLLRLSPDDLQSRFLGSVGDDFIVAHSDALFAPSVSVLGCFILWCALCRWLAAPTGYCPNCRDRDQKLNRPSNLRPWNRDTAAVGCDGAKSWDKDTPVRGRNQSALAELLVIVRRGVCLYQKCRELLDRQASPTACVIDSQSVKSAEKGGAHIDPSGYDAGKKINGKKRHIVVDTEGLLMHAVVHPADVQERDGGILVLASLFGLYPFLKTLFADGGYQGPKFRAELAKLLPGLAVEIVKRSDTAQGFEVLPRRWVVERTFAWLNRCRRLAKDFENRSRNALAFIRLASIRLMLRKLSNSNG